MSDVNAIQNYREWKSWDATSFAQCDVVSAAYYAAEIHKSEVSISSGMRCFEVGFGNGQFAAWAIAQGLEYSASELNPDLLELAINNGVKAYSATLNLQDCIESNSQNLIVAFDVLEHLTLEEICTLLKSVASCLSDTGKFIARFPSGDSPFSRAIQYGDITHKSVIGSSMIRQLCISSGLKISQIRSPVFPLTSLGIVKFLRRLPIVITRSVISKFINLCFNDGQARVISPNMVVVFSKELDIANE